MSDDDTLEIETPETGTVPLDQPVATGRRNVLVIRLGALGDLIQCFDTFHAIRRHHPDDRLILMTMPMFINFGRAMPWFDEVWLDDRPRPWRVGAWFKLRRQFRAMPLSRVYDLQNKFRTEVYFRLMPEPKPEWSGLAKGCSHPRPDDITDAPLHNRERYLRQVESAGVAEAGTADTDWLDADISAFKLPERFVMLVPGCSEHLPHKRWPAAHYAELIRRLEAQGLQSVLIGTKAERGVIQEIADAAPQAVSLCGKTSLLQLGAIARRALGAVGNDTGPIFLSAALACPTLMLMSHHTDPVRSAPRGAKVAWIKRDDLAELSVDEVEQAVLLRD